MRTTTSYFFVILGLFVQTKPLAGRMLFGSGKNAAKQTNSKWSTRGQVITLTRPPLFMSSITISVQLAAPASAK